MDEEALARELAAAKRKTPLAPPAGDDFKLSEKPGSTWFSSKEALALANAAVSFQTPAGGWSKKISLASGTRKPGMNWSGQGSSEMSWHYFGTFDNRATTDHLRLLAGVYAATREPRFSDAFHRGLSYIFAAQFPTGGWPQVYPLEGGYHDCITFNDDAQIRIMRLLREVADRSEPFALATNKERKMARLALKRGVACILEAQIPRNGKPTVWCAQHDPLTLAAANARKMEPAALSGAESMGIVEFLMGIPNPPRGVIESVESALAWFTRSKIPPDSPIDKAQWARFYDIASNRPIFPGRDGRIYDSLEALRAHNPVGYAYFTNKPRELLTKRQARWHKMLETEKSK